MSHNVSSSFNNQSSFTVLLSLKLHHVCMNVYLNVCISPYEIKSTSLAKIGRPSNEKLDTMVIIFSKAATYYRCSVLSPSKFWLPRNSNKCACHHRQMTPSKSTRAVEARRKSAANYYSNWDLNNRLIVI